MKLVLILFILTFLSLPAVVNAVDPTTVGTPTVVGLTRLITIQAPYTGDDNNNNFATFQYKKASDNNWLDTFPMYVDRTTKIWHGVSYGLETDTNYDIRVLFTDSDGVTGSPWTGTKQTKKDGTRPLGTGPVYWVDGTNGDDANPGTQAQPWKTISRSVSSLAAGVTVRIKAGTYKEQVTIAPSTNLGSVGNPITFENAPGETVIIDGEFTRNYGFLFGAYGRRIYDVVIRGLTVRNTLSSNIRFEYGQYLTVEDSVLEEARNPGSSMPAGLEMRGQYLVFRRNRVINTGTPLPVYPPLWKSGVQGVMLWENTGGEHSVYGNTFLGDRYDDAVSTGPEGRSNSGWVRDSEMYNNTIYTPNDDGWQSEGGVARSVFWNNTVINPRMAGIAIAPIMAGPAYIFDNLVIDNKATTQAVGIKAGDQSPAKGYIVHNTFYRTDNGPSNYGGGGGWANQEYYNNLIWARNYVLWGLEAIGNSTGYGGSPGLVFNYNSYYSESSSKFIDMDSAYYINGVEKFLNLASWQAASGQDLNSIQGNPLLDSNYKPLSNSPVIDKAYYYPQVGDTFSGLAPDIGAFEYDSGAPPVDTTQPSASISINSGASTTASTSVTLTLSCSDASGVNAVRYSNDGVFDTEVWESFASTKSWTLTSGDGAKTVWYQCRDNSANQNIATVSDTIILDSTAPVDTTPPVRSNGQPTGTLAAGTNQAIMNLTTDEAAACRYSNASGVAYGSMTDAFSTTGSTFHSRLMTGLANGSSYRYYIRCNDTVGNANIDDYNISFSVGLTGENCVDNDSDNYYSPVNCTGGNDCNDASAAVNPSAVEVCGNGIDENCDGVDASCTACSEGSIPATGCICGSVNSYSGYCCSNAYQSTACQPPTPPPSGGGGGGVTPVGPPTEIPITKEPENKTAVNVSQTTGSVSLEMITPDRVESGELFNVTVWMLSPITSAYSLTVGDVQQLVELEAGEEMLVTIPVRAPEARGSYTLTAEIGETVRAKDIDLDYLPLFLYVSETRVGNETFVNLTVKNYEPMSTELRVIKNGKSDAFFELIEGKKEYNRQLKLTQAGEYKIIATASSGGQIVDTDEYLLTVGGERGFDYRLIVIIVFAFVVMLVTLVVMIR